MELRVLHYFLTVAREQNISAAAESLHLSQPTLSIQIRQMEEELGKQLLVRGRKGSRRIELTDEGRIVRKRAEEILDLVQKMEQEVSASDQVIEGDVYIGTGETDTVRLLARAARSLQSRCPHIRYHISSGNAGYVFEQLDKGLVDFGVVYGAVDPKKYAFIQLPQKDTMGVLMRRDHPLAVKEAVCPQDLWDQPLILSHQRGDDRRLSEWLGREVTGLHIAATYNLVFNASLLVDEGLGLALCYDKLINTAESGLCFRPLTPRLEMTAQLVWKRYQVFSRASERFLSFLRQEIGIPDEQAGV